LLLLATADEACERTLGPSPSGGVTWRGVIDVRREASDERQSEEWKETRTLRESRRECTHRPRGTWLLLVGAGGICTRTVKCGGKGTGTEVRRAQQYPSPRRDSLSICHERMQVI
jgi:hypothetical protein